MTAAAASTQSSAFPPKKNNDAKFRMEKDALGEVRVPAHRLWGAQTQRSVENFKIATHERMPPEIIHAMGVVKLAAARVNRSSGKLPSDLFNAIDQAASEVCEGLHAEQFPLVVWQTGSGTQTNMNVNEVIANRAIQILGGQIGTKTPVHPNDHVNMGQSSNDTFPTAMSIAVALQTKNSMIPALRSLHHGLTDFAARHHDTVKIGRTHLQDATPLTLGQEFSGFAACLARGIRNLEAQLPQLGELAQGGTAVGTGLNTYEGFAEAFAQEVAQVTGESELFSTAPNKFEALGSVNVFVQLSATLATVASDLMKIACDIRLLGSGPRCGLGELQLPENEPGSSIMPGKVNPTQCEALTMLCGEVLGNHAAVLVANTHGHLQLNVMRPLVVFNVLRSLRLLADGCESFQAHCVAGLRADADRIAAHLSNSLMLVTALSKRLGYDACARIATHAHSKGLTLRNAAVELGELTAEEFDAWVQPAAMLAPYKLK